jgi:hypothetical protein
MLQHRGTLYAVMTTWSNPRAGGKINKIAIILLTVGHTVNINKLHAVLI